MKNKKIFFSLLIVSLLSQKNIYNHEAATKEITINLHATMIRNSLPAHLVKDINLLVNQNLANQINQLNQYDPEKLFDISKNITDQIIEKLSESIAESMYELEIDFETDPEKVIKFINENIDKYQIYIESALLIFKGMLQDLTQEYNEIKNKYNKLLYVITRKHWQQEATVEEQKKVTELEIKIQSLNRVIKYLNRTKLLIKVADWVIYSKTPFAWGIRKHIGF